MAINPDKQPIKKSALDEDKIAGVPMDGSRFADTAFDDDELKPYQPDDFGTDAGIIPHIDSEIISNDSETDSNISDIDAHMTTDYSTMLPLEEAWHRLDELKTKLDNRYKNILNEHQSLLNNAKNIEQDRKTALSWLTRARLKIQEYYRARTQLETEESKLKNALIDIEQRRQRINEISKILKKSPPKISVLLDNIRDLHTDSFKEHSLQEIDDFTATEQRFFLHDDMKSGEELAERAERSLLDPEYSGTLLDYVENETAHESAINIPAIIEKFWKLEVGAALEPPLEIKINGRVFLFSRKIGQGSFGMVMDGTRFPTPEQAAQGKEPIEIVLKLTKVFNNGDLYKKNENDAKFIYKELAALQILSRDPFIDESGNVVYPEDLSTIPVSVMLEAEVSKISSPDQSMEHAAAEENLAWLTAQHKLLMNEYSEVSEERQGLINELTKLLEDEKTVDPEEKLKLGKKIDKIRKQLIKLRENNTEAFNKIAALKRQILSTRREITIKHGDKRAFLLAQEKIAGPELKELLARYPKFETGMDYAEQIVSALSYIHNSGIRHTDLKPANIMLGANNRLKIVDFGMAHFQANALPDATGLLSTIYTEDSPTHSTEDDTQILEDPNNKEAYAQNPQYEYSSIQITGTLPYMPPFLLNLAKIESLNNQIKGLNKMYPGNPEKVKQLTNEYITRVKTKQDYYATGLILRELSNALNSKWDAITEKQKAELDVLTYVANRLVVENAEAPDFDVPDNKDVLTLEDVVTILRNRNQQSTIQEAKVKVREYRATANIIHNKQMRLAKEVLDLKNGKESQKMDIKASSKNKPGQERNDAIDNGATLDNILTDPQLIKDPYTNENTYNAEETMRSQLE
ncbi:MAG: protein kinase [bacterium]|nr:protein kinase [bacterium]